MVNPSTPERPIPKVSIKSLTQNPFERLGTPILILNLLIRPVVFPFCLLIPLFYQWDTSRVPQRQ